MFYLDYACNSAVAVLALASLGDPTINVFVHVCSYITDEAKVRSATVILLVILPTKLC
jgi:hypothetical protein